jgi:hypothetical protein
MRLLMPVTWYTFLERFLRGYSSARSTKNDRFGEPVA